MTRLLITGAGAVLPTGSGVDGVLAALDGEPVFTEESLGDGRPVQVGRVGQLRSKEAAAEYRRWGQLDTYSRYGFFAARGALLEAGLPMGDPVCAGFGVMFGTAFGCMEENQRFDRFEVRDGKLAGASPLVFKGTVDNAPAGWVAVAWNIQGPNATFVSGDGAALEALWASEGLLRSGRARGLLVGGVERFVAMHLGLRRFDPTRQAEVPTEGAGVVLVETEESLRERTGGLDAARAELLGSARRRGPLVEALAEAVERLAVDPSELGLISLGLPQADERALAVAGRYPGASVSCDKVHFGEPHGAWGGLALVAALARLERDGDFGGRSLALVHGFGEGDEHFFTILRASGSGSGPAPAGDSQEQP